MAGLTLREQRAQDDPSAERDVTLDRDTRNALAEIVDVLKGRNYNVDARILQRVVEKWDANEATEILVTEDRFIDVVESVLGTCPHGVDLDREFCSKGCRR
jgi:hypothetical protein